MKNIENTGSNDWMYIEINGVVETIENKGFEIPMYIEKTNFKNNDVHRMRRASNSNCFFLLTIPMYVHEHSFNPGINSINQKKKGE